MAKAKSVASFPPSPTDLRPGSVSTSPKPAAPSIETGSAPEIRLIRVNQKRAPYIQSPTGTVKIDVGGVVHHIKISNFRRKDTPLPCSRLGRLFRAESRLEVLKYCDDYDGEKVPPTVYFDRNCSRSISSMSQ